MHAPESKSTEENSEKSVPSCSVVICTRDRPARLNRCLEAVTRLNYPRFEVLVVDNGPAQRQVREIALRWHARYLVEFEGGLSRARNRGARTCKSEIVAFLDDDAVPEADWLSALAVEFQVPQVMAVTGRILALGVDTEAERLFERMGGFDVGDERWEVDREHLMWFVLANFAGLGNEANLAFRRRAFDLWSGFDERLGRGTRIGASEGPYALFSLIDGGHRVVYTPHAVVRHPYPGTMEGLRQRHLKDLSAATAYMTFLFMEEPRYRWAVVRYVVGALRGKRRAWRPPLPGLSPPPRVVSPWRAFLALLAGPIRYARTPFRCKSGS